MGLQISDNTNNIKQKVINASIYGGTGLATIITFAVIVNFLAPELIKPLVNFFGGEKGFTLAVSSFASIFSALAVIGIAYLVSRYKSQSKVPELTVKKEGSDLIVTGKDVEKLDFDTGDKATIFTDHGDCIIIEKTDDAYKIIEGKQLFSKLQDGEEIKLKIHKPDQNLQKPEVINAIVKPKLKATV